MRRFIGGLLWLTSFAAALGIVYLIFLAPARTYTNGSDFKNVPDIYENILKSMPKKFSLENRRITVTISLTEEDINNIIMSKLNVNGDIAGIQTIIDDNRMDIYFVKKVLNLIPVEASAFLSAKMDDDKVKLVLDDSKLGRLELGKARILDKLKKSNIPFFDVRPLAGEIILEDKELGSIIKITKLSLEDKVLSADAEIKINSIEDLRKIMDILNKK